MATSSKFVTRAEYAAILAEVLALPKSQRPALLLQRWEDIKASGRWVASYEHFVGTVSASLLNTLPVLKAGQRYQALAADPASNKQEETRR